MFEVGQRVRVLPPFVESFPGEYTVAAPPDAPEDHDGEWPLPDTYWLDGVPTAFSAQYLEAVQ